MDKTFKIIIVTLITSFSFSFISGQANTCETAPLLCSLSELNGYMATMPESNFTGEFNASSMCPSGSDNPGGSNQNITWFSFIAGNATAQMVITFTDCMDSDGVDNTPYVQYGVYTDCNFTFSNNNTIVCEGGGGGVAVDDPITIDLLGMIPGDDYFFFIDGDEGTFCDYEIAVTQGGWANLLPDPTSLDCISGNCPQDGNLCSLGETLTFQPQDFDLTIDYIWTITPGPPDGPAGTTINPENTASFTFNNPGIYEICVVGDNGCSQTNPVCYELNVIETDAGELSASPETLCPTETSTVITTDFFETPPVEQAMIVVGPDGNVIDVQAGNTVDVTYDQCGVITVYSYNYLPGDAPELPAIGSPYAVPNCNADCCDLESIEVTFEDDEAPTFLDVPIDITIECDEMIPPIVEVTWNDNCQGIGTVEGTQMDDYNTCMGGTITRTWSFTDICENNVEESQVITINAQMEGSFDNEPEDETYDCFGDIPPGIDLMWSGACEGTAIVSPVDGPEPDACTGGTMTRTWSYNDPCGSFTEYIQTITINGSTGGDFVNPPGAITVACDLSDLPPLGSLEWVGDCAGSEIVMGSEMIDIESCSGGTVTREWSFTDPCGIPASYFQTITVSPPPVPLPVNPPPANVTLDCDEVPTTFPDLVFDNGQVGDCAIMGTAEPEIMGTPDNCGGPITVIWIYTDDCFIPHTYVQNIVISPAAPPEFQNPPMDMTISCLESIPTFPDLDYTNGESGACEITGTAEASENIDGDICGGDIVGIWQIPDPCAPGSFIEHIQTITIEPIEGAEWIDPPASVDIQCSEMMPDPIDLGYSNDETGTCEIIGFESPQVMGTSDVCGGVITYTWEFIDQCERLINHEQVITIAPASEATFINSPSDVTINCDEIPPTPPSLDYTNNETGVCLISGTEPAMTIDNSNSCGGTITYNWMVVDPCGRPINHSQTITITEAPIASFIDPPANITVDCDNIPPSALPLSYTNNDACEISGNVDPTINENYDICGGTIENTWTFIDECGRPLNYTQLITVNPAPIASFIDVPANATVACGDNASNPGNLSYSNNAIVGCLIEGEVPPTQTGGFTACGGDIQFTWDFIDECGRPIQAVQTVIVEPAPAAVFINLPPQDITVSCADFQTTPPNLSYTNSESGICLISGSEPGIVIGTPNPCGNTVQYRWEFSDDCGRNISYNQNVTIEQAPEMSFIDTPGPETVDCNNVPTTAPLLSYSNGASGICAINGNVSGIQSGVFDECGGNITYSWTFTDQCNRTITHDQIITINPASDPIFIDLPADITLDCGEDFPENPTLDYTNNEGGQCEISGTEVATSTSNGNTTTYTWSFINDCNGLPITYTQNITGVPTPDISIDPIETTICLGETFDLSTITVTDANGNPFTTTYELGGSSINNPNITPTGTQVYTIIATNDAGCSDNAIFTINVDSPPFAGTALDGQVCAQGGLTYNLFDYLSGSFTPGGTWFDTDGSGANIDNPVFSSFSGVTPGTYTFTYTVFSTNLCPNAEVQVEIEVIDELEFEVFSIQCDPGGATYSINVISNGNNIFSNPGDVTVIDANNVIINNIPAGSSTVISAIDANAFCISDQVVSAPDCDCPTIDSPISDGDITICEGDMIPQLSVTVSVGLTANWYEDQTSTTPLIEDSNTFTPDVSSPGIYNYYVEAEDSDGCVSLIRTLVTLTINANPILNNITVDLCADENGNATVDLQSLNNQINTNVNFIYSYYPTLTDADNDTNELDLSYMLTSNSTIYALVTNSTNCSAIAEVSIIVNLQPTFSIITNNEVCIDDMNGNILISDIEPTNTEFSLDNITFTSTTSFTNLAVGNYTLYAQSLEGCKSQLDFEILEGIEIIYSDLQIECNSNGTDSDSSDDFYTISFDLTNSLGVTSEVNIQSTAIDFGNFSYGNISFEIATGSSETITITDISTGCQVEFLTGELTPCSSNCSIAIDQLDVFCNGNGTDSDPSDDFYEITINASAINGASNNTFNVTVDNIVVANFTYNQGGIITIPAQGQTALISVVDNVDAQCFASQTIGPLTPCSNECIITIDNQNFICDNNATIGVPGDDFYTFSFTVLSTNSTSTTFDLFVDNINVGTYNYGELSSYELPADITIHDILFVDSSDDGCTVELTSPELIPCSGECSINIQTQPAVCQNQNTGTDPTDDTFVADIFINIVSGSSTWFIVETSQTGNSGETFQVGPYPISGGDVTLTIQDSNNPNCFESVIIEAPETCSSCDGTVEAGADQEIDCINTSATLTGEVSTNDIGIWTGPNNFTENINQVTVEEAGTYYFTVDFGEGCFLTDSVEVVLTSLSFISSTIVCNNNGTIGVPEDDFYTFSFNVTNTNPDATTYNLLLDAITVGTYNYGEDSEFIISADQSSHIFEIIDTDNVNCVEEFVTDILEECSGECEITVEEQSTSCNNENTADNSLDDTWTGQILINHIGGTGSWTIAETGQTGSPGDIITIGPYLISDGNVTLTISDAGIAGCEATLVVSPPPPCSNCNESVEAGADWLLDCMTTEADLNGIPSFPITGTWTGPAGFTFIGNQVTVEIPGTYYFTADFGNNCIRTDSLVIDVSNEVPQALAGNDQTLTCLVDTVTLNGSVLGGSGNFTYQWFDDQMNEISTELSIKVGESGNYFFVVYDIDSDCTSPPSVVVVFDETGDLDPEINANPSFVLDCVVSEIILQVVEEPNVEYKWFIGSVQITGSTTSLTVVDPGIFRLEATHLITGCTGMAELVIEDQIQYPIAFIQPAQVLDCDNDIISLDGSSSQVGESITYTWLDVDSTVIATNTNMLSITEGGIYYLQLQDEDNNCINFDTVIVNSNIDLPDVMLDDTAIINCNQDDVLVMLTTDLDPTTLNINWETTDGNIISGAMDTNLTLDAEGTYTVSVVNPNNNCETLDTIEVILPEQIESSSYTINDESCEESNNGSIIINSTEGGTEPYTYFIDNTELNGNLIEGLSEGIYELLVVDDNGCEYIESINIELQEPININLIPEITVTQGQTTQLVASINIPDSEIESILWSPATNLSCSTCLITEVTGGIGDTEYTIAITDINGCYTEAKIIVRSNDEIIITAPNVIKPSGPDNGNSLFTIYSTVEATINKIQVFDRWGNNVYLKTGFPTNDPTQGWDGRFQGEFVEQGVYVFYAEILVDQDLIIKKGDLTVIR